MKMNRGLLVNKKGVSTLFIAVYVVLIAIILLTTLFVGTTIYQSSLDTSLKIEQKRLQEQISVNGPNGIIMSESNPNIVAYLRVNNTGPITVRITSLYINDRFICDPSDPSFSPDTSYIPPGGSSWIDLTKVNPPITEDNLSAVWTIVTERGTKTSEVGLSLKDGPPAGDNTGKYYFGPILLQYYSFYWSSDNGVTWNKGWTIPKDNNGNNIIWRIQVADIDNRPIVLDRGSAFVLVQNSQQQNKIATWNLDNSGRNPSTLMPGHYYFLYFSRYSGPSFSDLYNPNPICSNFLTFIGNFREIDNSLTPMGQTIPFEAVLLTA